MHRKAGLLVVFLGIVLLTAAGFLFAYNRSEDQSAGEASKEVLEQLKAEMAEVDEMPSRAGNVSNDAQPYHENDAAPVEIEGNSYMGYLSIPVLGLELPVMDTWSYDGLQIAPCRYSGSAETGDFVIAAHNYTRHFGRLDRLKPGDEVLFTDTCNQIYHYRVEFTEILNADEVDRMLSAGYDLSLFSCTYGGGARVTVRCSKA